MRRYVVNALWQWWQTVGRRPISKASRPIGKKMIAATQIQP